MTDNSLLDALDENDQSTIDGLDGQGIDLTQPLAVRGDLGFATEQSVRQAAAELVLAGYPHVQVAFLGEPQLRAAFRLPPAWNVSATSFLVLTVESIRLMRHGLNAFAVARGGEYVGEGAELIPADATEWALAEPISGDDVTGDQDDQTLIDYLFAYDSDLKQSTQIRTGLIFSGADAARQAAAALLTAGYREVWVTPAKVGWAVTVITFLVPTPEAIRTLRVGLTKFAESGGGSWVGCKAGVAMPKGFDVQPS